MCFFLVYAVSSEELGAHVLELPYKGGDISLFVILPPFNKQRGISMLTKRLNTNVLRDIVASDDWRSRTVEVSLPKFNVEQSMDNLVPVSVFFFLLFFISFYYIVRAHCCETVSPRSVPVELTAASTQHNIVIVS